MVILSIVSKDTRIVTITFPLHYKGDVVDIVKVDTDYVINTLMVATRREKREPVK